MTAVAVPQPVTTAVDDEARVAVRRSRKYFPELESLRGIAILLVYLYHADGVITAAPHHASLPVAYMRAGHTGVALFFVLSGFLLSLPFLAEATGGRRQSRREYYLRRALRILPAYYTAVIVAMYLSAHRPSDVLQWWPFFVFTKALTPPDSLWPYSIGWWSLATEVQFYVVLPLLALAFRSRRRVLVALGAYAVVYATFEAGLWHLPSLRWQLEMHSNVFGRSPLFLWGIFAAWLYRTHGDAIRTRLESVPWVRAGGADVALVLVFIALGLLLRWEVGWGFWDAEKPPRHAWHIVEGACWATVLLSLLLAPLRTKRLFANGLLGGLGVVSYSLFLIHIPVMALAVMRLRARTPGSYKVWGADSLALTVALFALCVSASIVTYWAIERPFLVRKARLDR
jgi:peptidoglycan/LPS O-acetylase OafA/YrhL